MKRSALPTLADHNTFTGRSAPSCGKAAGCGPEGLAKGLMLSSAAQPPSSARLRIKAARMSAPERLEAHAHAFAEGGLVLGRLVQRSAIGRLGFRGLVLRPQDVALERLVLRVIGGGVRRLGELQRLVVGLFIDEERAQAQAR